MRVPKGLACLVVLTLLIGGTGFIPAATASFPSNPYTRRIAAGGTTWIAPLPHSLDGLKGPEFLAPEPDEGMPTDAGTITVNRSYSHGGGLGPAVTAGKKAKSNPELVLSFAGLNHSDQRLANGGNQFSVEPPDQGLCAGNGFVLESVNAVLRVFDTAGHALTGVTDLNTFYGYPAAIERIAGTFGPFLTDPSCYFDPDTQRWFHVVLTLEVNPATGDFVGPNHLDIAVSQTPNPTGPWVIYRLPAQNDGTSGTPRLLAPPRWDRARPVPRRLPPHWGRCRRLLHHDQ